MATVKSIVKNDAYEPLRDVNFPSGKRLQLGGVAVPGTVSFTPAAGGANVCEVTIAVKDAAGNALAGVRNLEIWLSDAASGAGLTGTTASGAVAVKASSGTDLTALTAKKHLIGQTKSDGTYILSITDTAKTLFYVCVRHPMTGAPIVSAKLVSGNYGS